MRHPYRLSQKTSFARYDEWGFYIHYISEAPNNEQGPSIKNANKIIAKQVKQLNRRAFRNKQIRGR